MATIDRRKSKRGVITWRVRWREGGTREDRTDSETCDSWDDARDFAALVRLAGERRPEGYPKGCRGVKLIAAESQPNQADSESAQTMSSVSTFGEVFAEYLGFLRKRMKKGKIEARQIEGYRRLFDRHVRTAVVELSDGTKAGPLGGLRVGEITTEVIDAWVSWMSERTYVYRKAKKDGEEDDVRTYTPKTVLNVHGGVISPALGYAARTGYIEVNPCAGVELPVKPGRSVSLDHVPTGEEIEEWISTGYEVSQLAGDIITLAMGTGLRWSEMIALRPCDVDLEHGLLTVAQVVKEDDKRRLYIAPYGKSHSALRTLRLGAEVITMLTRRMEGLGDRELIFRGARGGILNSSGWSQTHWAKVVAKMRERNVSTQATPHKFRHAHATELLAANVSLDTVSKRLGHASIVITGDLYSHRTPEADQAAVAVIDGVMTGKGRTPASAAA